ncbi:hypothetical protein BG011_008867, partial [Mortierella polycephala]
MLSSDEFPQTVRGLSSKMLGQLNMSQYSRAERRIINDELVRRSVERKANKSTVKSKSQKSMPSSSSMYPELFESVDEYLRKPFTFYNVDDDGLQALKEFDTFVSGVFRCSTRCSNRGWSSGKIAISIRLYDHDQYNARIYHQHCRGCGALSRPTLDSSTYSERVSYRLNKWCGFIMDNPRHGSRKTTPPHDCENCEGCALGRCPHDKDDVKYFE